MKRFALSVLVFVASGAYVVSNTWRQLWRVPLYLRPPWLLYKPHTSAHHACYDSHNAAKYPHANNNSYFNTNANPTQVPTPTPTPVVTPTPAPVVKTQGSIYRRHLYGSTADAYYGTVQVQVVIQNGKIVTVKLFAISERPPRLAIYQRTSNAASLERGNRSAERQRKRRLGCIGHERGFIQSLGDALTQAKKRITMRATRIIMAMACGCGDSRRHRGRPQHRV